MLPYVPFVRVNFRKYSRIMISAWIKSSSCINYVSNAIVLEPEEGSTTDASDDDEEQAEAA